MPPELPHAIAMATMSRGQMTYNDTVEYVCDEGHVTQDGSVFARVTCMENGDWSKPLTTCESRSK